MRDFLLVILAIASMAITTTVSAKVTNDQLLLARDSSPHLARLLDQADRNTLYEDPQWLALVHYEKKIFSQGFIVRRLLKVSF
jgi:hypothetical protein